MRRVPSQRAVMALFLALVALAATGCLDFGGPGHDDDTRDTRPDDTRPDDDTSSTDTDSDLADTDSDSPDADTDDASDTDDADTTPLDDCRTTTSCATGTVCDPDTGDCVACLGATHCAPGELCVDHACQPPPTCADPAGADCPAGSVCDTAAGLCVECLADTDCPGGVCKPQGQVCVGCLDDADCPDDAVCDATTATCVGCRDDADCVAACEQDGVDPCPAAFCAKPDLACVECTEDSHCAALGTAAAPWTCLLDTHRCLPVWQSGGFSASACYHPGDGEPDPGFVIWEVSGPGTITAGHATSADGTLEHLAGPVVPVHTLR